MPAPSAEPAGLLLRGVRKDFGKLTAVRDLDLEVAPGELFGFLGPNGAGKTTTIKMIAGLLEPTRGRIIIDGINLAAEPMRAKQTTGYIPDRPYLYGKLTAREFFALTGGLYRIPQEEVDAFTAEWCGKFRLEGWQDNLLESYSHGMRQKVVLISALLIKPKLLVVDEPMVGLDPLAARLLKDALREFCAGGGTIFLSTHTLDVADELCTRIGIIHRGELLTVGSPAELRTAAGLERSKLEEVFLRCTEEIENQG